MKSMSEPKLRKMRVSELYKLSMKLQLQGELSTEEVQQLNLINNIMREKMKAMPFRFAQSNIDWQAYGGSRYGQMHDGSEPIPSPDILSRRPWWSRIIRRLKTITRQK